MYVHIEGNEVQSLNLAL